MLLFRQLVSPLGRVDLLGSFLTLTFDGDDPFQLGQMPFGVLQAMFKHPLTDAGLKRFKEDYLKSQEARPAQAEAVAKR